MKINLVLAAAFVLVTAVASAADSQAKPRFFARQDYPGQYTSSINVADTNGDGIPDIIGVSIGCNALVWFGNGDGSFHLGASSVTGMADAQCSAVAADMNGDGKIDLVYVGAFQHDYQPPQGVGVSFGNGDGTFQPAVQYPAGTDIDMAYLVAADFNNDGILDVATVGASGVWVFMGKGGGVLDPGVLFPLPNTPYSPQIAAGYFNADGYLDLAVSSYPTGFLILLGNGDGTFGAPQTFTTPKRPNYIAVGDVNMDGYSDVVVTVLNEQYVYLYLSDGAGGFSGPSYVHLPSGFDVTIADVNGDGIPDLANSAGDIAFGKGDGTFKPPVYYPVEASLGASNVVAADLRNNGLIDLVVQGQPAGTISVLLNDGKGKFRDGERTTVPDGAGCGVSADFNGDGKPDLAMNNNLGVAILLGTGSASAPFTVGTQVPISSGVGCLVTGDLNGDGIPDLLVPTGAGAAAYLGKRRWHLHAEEHHADSRGGQTLRHATKRIHNSSGVFKTACGPGRPRGSAGPSDRRNRRQF